MSWKKAVLGLGEKALKMAKTPPLLKGLAFEAIRFAVRCRASNPVSFALRPILGHKRLRLGVGAILTMVTVSGWWWGPLPSLAGGNRGGTFDLVVLPEGEVSLETEEAVNVPVDEFRLTQRFWWLHGGVDLAAAVGTPIKPVMAGRVEEVKLDRWGYGKHVLVDHGNGYASLYAHLSEIEVAEGQTVGGRSILGKVGSTGRSTGPHLHLEIRENGKLVNPAGVLGL